MGKTEAHSEQVTSLEYSGLPIRWGLKSDCLGLNLQCFHFLMVHYFGWATNPPQASFLSVSGVSKSISLKGSCKN